MRHLLLLAPLLALSRPSDACGYYPPHVWLVDTTFDQRHSFVLTDRAEVPAWNDARWTQVVPHSYDDTSVIAIAKPEHAIALTLLGDGFSAETVATERVFVRAFPNEIKPMRGLAIPAHSRTFRLAMSGSHVGAEFKAVDVRGHVDDVETQLSYDTDGAPHTRIVRGDREIGTFDGRALGRLDADGMRYALVEHDGVVRTIMI